MSDFIDDTVLEQFPELLRREPESIFRRYIDAHDEELDEFDADFTQVIASHQVDNATGNDLNRIGRLFGELGRRQGRTDTEYRVHLKHIIQSFNGRGTVPGIKFAVSSGLNVQADTVEVEEHFDDIEYTIILNDWEAHSGSNIEELADLSDASVSRLREIVYKIDEDEVGVTDDVSVSEGVAISDSAGVDDAAAVNQNKRSVSDGAAADDSVSVTETTVAWNIGDWGSMEWAVEHN